MSIQTTPVPGSSQDVDPRTYGTDQEQAPENPALQKLTDAKADGSLLTMSAAERAQLYKDAYGGPEEQSQSEVDRAAEETMTGENVTSGDEEYEALRRSTDNGLATYGMGVSQEEQNGEDGTKIVGTADSPEEAAKSAVSSDPQLNQYSQEQLHKIDQRVQQAVENSESAQRLRNSELARNPGAVASLYRAAARVLRAEGSL